MRKENIKQWCVLFNKRKMNSSLYNSFKKHYNYIRLYDESDKAIIDMKMIYIKALCDIPEFGIEKDKEYLAQLIKDFTNPRLRTLYIFNTKFPEDTYLSEFDTSDITQYFRLYSDGVVPMKIKRRIKTNKMFN